MSNAGKIPLFFLLNALSLQGIAQANDANDEFSEVHQVLTSLGIDLKDRETEENILECAKRCGSSEHHHHHSSDACPIDAPSPFQNPFIAPNDISEANFNSFQTNTTSIEGPANFHCHSATAELMGPVPLASLGTIAFNESGQLITIRSGPEPTPLGTTEIANSLLLIDLVTLETISSLALPRKSPIAPGLNWAQEGYFFLNEQFQVVSTSSGQQIQIYALRNDTFQLLKQYQLSQAINNAQDSLISVLPDAFGNLWFNTFLGGIGYVSHNNQDIYFKRLKDFKGGKAVERITKSLATDENGGVFLVSDYALYRFAASTPTNILLNWRTEYDRGTRIKPGQYQQGSGTTPTLFNDFNNRKFAAITDNADPHLHVNIYNRVTGVLIAQQACFAAFPMQNATEGSLTAVNHSIIVANNYGNSSVQSTLNSRTTTPGIERIDFNAFTGESKIRWSRTQISIPSATTQLSLKDGYLYTYGKDTMGWYWAAINFKNGKLKERAYIPGNDFLGGVFGNSFYSSIGISPDHTAYIGTLGGMAIWRPTKHK